MVSPISRISVENFFGAPPRRRGRGVEVEVEVEKKSKRSKIDSRGENQESGMFKHMFWRCFGGAAEGGKSIYFICWYKMYTFCILYIDYIVYNICIFRAFIFLGSRWPSRCPGWAALFPKKCIPETQWCVVYTYSHIRYKRRKYIKNQKYITPPAAPPKTST